MNATLTDLRHPTALLKAAAAGEPIILTEHGRAAYELRKITPRVDWDDLEAGRAGWLTDAESDALAAAVERSAKVLTHDRVP